MDDVVACACGVGDCIVADIVETAPASETELIIQQCALYGCSWFPRAHADVDILPVFC